MVTPSLKNDCSKAVVLNRVVNREVMTCHSMDEPLEAILISHDVINVHTREKKKYTRFLNAFTAHTPRQCTTKLLM